MTTKLRILLGVLSIALVTSACGDGDGNPDTDTEGDETTTTAPTAEAAYRVPGPYGTGVVTLELPTGNAVEVYYPSNAVEPGEGDESYRVSQFLPENLQALIPEDAPDSFEVAAVRGAPPAIDEGPFPLVVFSHGFSSFRLQSTHLLTHLASWGMVVASTDHPARDLPSQLGETRDDPPAPEDDVVATIDLDGWAGDDDQPVLFALTDRSLVAVGGHSAGGGTALAAAAADADVLGYVSYASGTWDVTELPDMPSLFMAGANDDIVESARTEAAFDAAPAPSWLWVVDRAGHLAFSDLCAIGRGSGGLLGMAEAAELPVPENLRPLATDGCEAPNVDVREVWPAIEHASVAFYRFVFGIDREPVGLRSAVADDFEIELTIEEKQS